MGEPRRSNPPSGGRDVRWEGVVIEGVIHWDVSWFPKLATGSRFLVSPFSYRQ